MFTFFCYLLPQNENEILILDHSELCSWSEGTLQTEKKSTDAYDNVDSPLCARVGLRDVVPCMTLFPNFIFFLAKFYFKFFLDQFLY